MTEPDATPMISADELREQITALLNSFAERRREIAEKAKEAYTNDWRNDYFYRGVITTYNDVIKDLSELLQTGDDIAQPVPPPPPQYLAVGEEEVSTMLNRVGVYARQVIIHADGAVTAIFARMQPIPQEERIAKLKTADTRIVILDTGKLPDSGEPYIDFALTME